MTRLQALVAAAFVLVAALIAFFVWRASAPETIPTETIEDPSQIVKADGDSVGLRLYFPGGGWLVAEERSIPAEGGGADLRRIAAEVLAGPESPGLRAPFPADTEVGSVFISVRGIAYVDLVSTRAAPPSSGSRDEMLSVYSLVNSVQANLPDLAGVVLLWNGQQRPTFAGHLDTGMPLKTNRSLVSRP